MCWKGSCRDWSAKTYPGRNFWDFSFLGLSFNLVISPTLLGFNNSIVVLYLYTFIQRLSQCTPIRGAFRGFEPITPYRYTQASECRKQIHDWHRTMWSHSPVFQSLHQTPIIVRGLGGLFYVDHAPYKCLLLGSYRIQDYRCGGFMGSRTFSAAFSTNYYLGLGWEWPAGPNQKHSQYLVQESGMLRVSTASGFLVHSQRDFGRGSSA